MLGGWLEKVRIRLNSASTGVAVEVGAELGNCPLNEQVQERKMSGFFFLAAKAAL